jgi:hypothetical protein
MMIAIFSRTVLPRSVSGGSRLLVFHCSFTAAGARRALKALTRMAWHFPALESQDYKKTPKYDAFPVMEAGGLEIP